MLIFWVAEALLCWKLECNHKYSKVWFKAFKRDFLTVDTWANRLNRSLFGSYWCLTRHRKLIIALCDCRNLSFLLGPWLTASGLSHVMANEVRVGIQHICFLTFTGSFPPLRLTIIEWKDNTAKVFNVYRKVHFSLTSNV